jgi:hypothetical protein
MKAVLIQPNEIPVEKALHVSQDLSGADLVAEILRNELAAQKVCSRRTLCNKVVALAEPIQKTSVDHVKEVLTELESNGDVTKGMAGLIATSPLRAVKVGPKRYSLHGCVPARTLKKTFIGMELFWGINRLLVVEDDNADISEKVQSAGGILLSPERWAGLMRTPFADRKWIDSLESLLENQKIPAGALDEGINDGWQCYSPEQYGKAQNLRWEKSDKGSGNFWRGWHERGWYVFAWTNGESPSIAPCLKLNSDQAIRSMFALDRDVNNPVPISVNKENKRISFRIAGFLPISEYRYLTTLGEYEGKYSNYFCFNLPSDIWEEVSQKLEERLGIKSELEEL